ncbi:MAG: carbohydrate kinase family protein [Anaerolineaceae bacterium]|nr:carbohydrate kinase family protein [Anaerolineaceae bacterium]
MGYDIIVSGQLCADLLPDTAHLPLSALSSPGKIFEVGKLEMATGGGVANTGLALNRLGVTVGLMATVGDDMLGRVIIDFLKDEGAHLADLVKVRPNEDSSYSVILSPTNTDRIILHCPGTNEQFTDADIDFELVSQAKIFHLGYPPLLPRLFANEGDMLVAIYQRVYDMSVVTSLDMALSDLASAGGQVDWRPIIQHTLPYVDVFIPSLEEIAFMLRRADYDRWQGRPIEHVTISYLRKLANDLLAMGVAIAGIKLGEYGLFLRCSEELGRFDRLQRLGLNCREWCGFEGVHPTFDVKLVGSVGAGDSAYGAFLAGLLRGLPPEDVVRMACAVGASNVEAHDATSGIRSWDDTLARINAGWETSPKQLPE